MSSLRVGKKDCAYLAAFHVKNLRQDSTNLWNLVKYGYGDLVGGTTLRLDFSRTKIVEIFLSKFFLFTNELFKSREEGLRIFRLFPC